MMGNPFDQFDAQKVSGKTSSNPFDRFDDASKRAPNSSDIQDLTPAQKVENDARYAASVKAGVAPSPEPEPSKDSLFGMANGALNEVPKALARGAIAGIVGPIYGVGREIFAGKLGDGSHYAEQEAAKAADAISYKPTTNTARWAMEKIGAASEPLQAIPAIHDIQALSQGAASSARSISQLAAPTAAMADVADAATLANGAKGSIRELMAKPKAMAGGGAALADEAKARIQRAASMNPPLQLTKGMVTREPAQVRFESDTARQPGGEPLNQRNVELNKRVFQNIDNMIDETGAKAPELRVTGKVIDKAMVGKFDMKQKEVRDAYGMAREAGHMDAPVDYSQLSKFLSEHEAEATVGQANMLSFVKQKLKELDPKGTGKININDAEILRQKAEAITNDGTPNAAFIKPVKELIDGMTEPETVGGPLYRQARRLNENFKNEFENVKLIDDLLRTKPGSKTRAVAVEDISDRILNASTDETRHAFRLLTAFPKGASPDLVAQGAQAARELRGALIDRIKKAAFENATRDSSNNSVGNFSSVNRLINSLDEDGKLEVVLGKTGAQRVRDFRDSMGDVYSKPPNVVNGSNNAAEIIGKIDKLRNSVGALRSIPGLSSSAKYVEEKISQRQLKKKVNSSLNPQGDE